MIADSQLRINTQNIPRDGVSMGSTRTTSDLKFEEFASGRFAAWYHRSVPRLHIGYAADEMAGPASWEN